MKDIVVKIENISKNFFLGQRGYQSFREDMVNFFVRKEKNRELFWALKNISFELKKGEILGIIGPNGAGKSTLLKMLARVMVPTSGKVFIEGRIGALIELAAGFHPELTGRENIYLYGSIMGMKKREINEKFQEIVDFSGLEKFLDTPLKRYSSGMKARLGFSVSAHINPNILLIDEVLSVGDLSFQAKCLSKMEEYKNKGITIIFVSHNMDSIRKICQRTILLKKGQILIDGDTGEAIDKYFRVVSEERKNLFFVSSDGQRKEMVKIKDVQLLNSKGQLSSHFSTGETAIFKYKVFFRGDAKVFFNFLVWRSDRLLVYDTSQYLLTKQYVNGESEAEIFVEFRFKVDLLKGTYHIGTHITDFEKNIYHDVIDNAVFLFVTEDISYGGVANLNSEIKITDVKKISIS